MSELLFLSHRIPYPPDKGDKIRSYNLLRALSAQHTVHVGTFVDDPDDWRHVPALQQLCRGETCVRPLNPRSARMRSATGLLSGEALTLAYYRDAALSAWTRDLAARRPLAGVFVFSSSMCQYALDTPLQAGRPRVADFCDVDSDKWEQYAGRHGYPMKLVYSREARTLAEAERRYVGQFDASIVISEAEAEILRRIAGPHADRIRVVPNGVDTEYFDPGREYPDPYAEGELSIAFTGAMDYQANVDGVCWFAAEILPAVRRELPNAVFTIVGSNPTEAVRALAQQPGVRVTGRVPDVRPYLAHARLVVAPLRIARGVQNKVLEALAMARPVVATENALQGIPSAAALPRVSVANETVAFAADVIGALRDATTASQSREFTEREFSWKAHLQAVTELFDASRSRFQGGARASVA
jgi:sugar transferase (PEP-CTERM/EpsH1 system associated)